MVRDLGATLKGLLPPSDVHMLNLIAGVAEAQGLPLYAVGGLPRDLVLDRMPSDFDLVVEGSAIALARALAVQVGGSVTSHARFGTAQWHLEQLRVPWATAGRSEVTQRRGAVVDLVSARRESYSRPGALPEVSLGSIQDDLRRRDFTINTLALRLDGSHYGDVLDPLHAMRDLRIGVIRALHEESFRDDPTRMLRAVRYEQRLGFRIEPRTLRMIPPSEKWLRRVSAARVRHELDAALHEERAAAMIRRMGNLGLLKSIHRALPSDGPCIRRLRLPLKGGTERIGAASGGGEGSMRWLLWFLDLPPAQIRSVRHRLLFDGRLTTQMLAAAGLWRVRESLAGLRPSRLTKKLDDIPAVSVKAVERAVPKGRLKRKLQDYLAKWRRQRPITTGTDLARRGVAYGPMFRKTLEHLRAGWIDGSIASAEDEQRALDAWLRRPRSLGKRGAKGRKEPRRHRA